MGLSGNERRTGGACVQVESAPHALHAHEERDHRECPPRDGAPRLVQPVVRPRSPPYSGRAPSGVEVSPPGRPLRLGPLPRRGCRRHRDAERSRALGPLTSRCARRGLSPRSAALVPAGRHPSSAPGCGSRARRPAARPGRARVRLRGHRADCLHRGGTLGIRRCDPLRPGCLSAPGERPDLGGTAQPRTPCARPPPMQPLSRGPSAEASPVRSASAFTAARDRSHSPLRRPPPPVRRRSRRTSRPTVRSMQRGKAWLLLERRLRARSPRRACVAVTRRVRSRWRRWPTDPVVAALRQEPAE